MRDMRNRPGYDTGIDPFAERFTGTEYGETITDEQGERWHQVFEYEDGECTDRYVTKAGVQL